MLAKEKNIERKTFEEMDLSLIDKYIISKINDFKDTLQKNIEEYNLTFVFSEMNKLVQKDMIIDYPK